MTLLSICIPTYNRKECLKHLLKSILAQKKEEIEIVISDNCSRDGTPQLAKQFSKQLPIRYFRFSTEVPCGKNLLNSVILASSPYCWLMSDDDALEDNALEKVLMHLKENKDLCGISVNVQGYTRCMHHKKEIKYSHQLYRSKLFRCSEEAFSSLGAWMGFWSAHIINKKLWIACQQDQKYLEFEGYHHLFLMAAMLKSNPAWFFLHEKLVAYRSDHESFTHEYGREKRFCIDVRAYKQIPALFFSSSTCKAVEKIVLKQLLFWQLLRAKCEGLSLKTILNILLISFKNYKKRVFFWIAIVPLLFCPKVFFLILRSCYRRSKKIV